MTVALLPSRMPRGDFGTSRLPRSAEVVWQITEPWLAGQNYSSPDLSPGKARLLRVAVQEAVDSTLWAPGSALYFVIYARSQLSNFTRIATTDPTLTVSYTDR